MRMDLGHASGTSSAPGNLHAFKPNVVSLCLSKKKAVSLFYFFIIEFFSRCIENTEKRQLELALD